MMEKGNLNVNGFASWKTCFLHWSFALFSSSAPAIHHNNLKKNRFFLIKKNNKNSPTPMIMQNGINANAIHNWFVGKWFRRKFV